MSGSSFVPAKRNDSEVLSADPASQQSVIVNCKPCSFALGLPRYILHKFQPQRMVAFFSFFVNPCLSALPDVWENVSRKNVSQTSSDAIFFNFSWFCNHSLGFGDKKIPEGYKIFQKWASCECVSYIKITCSVNALLSIAYLKTEIALPLESKEREKLRSSKKLDKKLDGLTLVHDIVVLGLHVNRGSVEKAFVCFPHRNPM